jgi:hypothetical protein
MRVARKLLLFCAMAFAAATLGASTASAQETPVEIWQEDGSHCEPCELHIVGSSSFAVHIPVPPFEQTITSCDDEFEVELWEDEFDEGGGETRLHQGHVIDYDNNIGSAACTRRNCDGLNQGEEPEWETYGWGEAGPNEGHFRYRFCLEPEAGGQGAHCDIEVHFEEVNVNHHQYMITASDTPADSNECIVGTNELEFDGEWFTEEEAEVDGVPNEHNEIEIVHV